MSKLNVEIVTPERRLAKEQADEVIAPGAEGLFGVRPGHTPYLAAMQPGALTVRDGATTTAYFVTGGFVEADPSVVRVLADSAVLVADIDVAAAKAAIADAEAKLKDFEPTDERGEPYRAVLRVETRRLEVAAGR